MSQKSRDNKNRWRSVTVGFRMSPEEAKQLDNLVKLSGLSKQNYIISKLMCRDVVVQANPRLYKALREKMIEIYEQLKLCKMNDETLETLQVIAITLNGLKKDRED